MLMCVGAGTALCRAQGFATDPLQRGQLVVWVVQTDPPPRPTADEVRRTLHTATAGSFGTVASEVGHTAGSYGISSGQAGRGVSSGTAGSVGTAAGNFGQPPDAVAFSGRAPSSSTLEQTALGQGWEELGQQIRRGFPGLRFSMLAVRSGDLQERFAALREGSEQPDLLLGDVSMVQRSPFLRERTLFPLGVAALNELPSGARVNDAALPVRREWLILTDAPHPAEARALVVWLRDGRKARAEQGMQGAAPDALWAMAIGAAESLLRGTVIAGADRTMVTYSPAVAQQQALNAPSAVLSAGLGVRVNVLAQAANERFALFGLRAVVESPDAFGVVYPMVVLRRQTGGRWTVLHVTGDAHASGPTNWSGPASWLGPLQAFTARWPAEQLKPVRGVVLAAPVDGDSRAGIPDLWWDDPGDAEELVVEWSKDRGAAHLLYVPDGGPRLEVRVPASFADIPGEYRWRVWSVGRGGVLDLSAWRRMTVLP